VPPPHVRDLRAALPPPPAGLTADECQKSAAERAAPAQPATAEGQAVCPEAARVGGVRSRRPEASDQHGLGEGRELSLLREVKRSGAKGRWRRAVSPPATRQAEKASKNASDSRLTLQPIGGPRQRAREQELANHARRASVLSHRRGADRVQSGARSPMLV
jgi:hypothetical protein